MGNVLSGYETSSHEVHLQGSLGSIEGLQFDTKARRYAGVPYALPPTGDGRWRKPQPLPDSYCYSTTTGKPFDATKFGPICLQPSYAGKTIKKEVTQHVYSEDCLRLNIWTPAGTPPKDGWPVFLWLHGGWFQMGDPSHEMGMDPTELISTGKFNAIVVAIGYRLSIFGFLAGDALEIESEGAGEAGNYGLWDQRLAMEWVKENIVSFGGDSERITLAGRSAGAYAVEAQAIYDFQTSVPTSEKYFHAMFMNSNAIPAQPKTVKEAQPQFDEICKHFGISLCLPGAEKLSMLRKIDGKDLTDIIMNLNYHTFRPVTDGVFIRPGLMEYIADGSFAEVFKQRKLRLLIGEMLNEETLYGVTNSPEPNLESLHLQITNYYAPSITSNVLQHYNLPNTDVKSDWVAVFGKIISDGQVRAPSRCLVNSLFTHGVDVHDVWRYCISYRLSFITEKVAPLAFGVSHAMDKPFWK
jgi:carboxylesterase type B